MFVMLNVQRLNVWFFNFFFFFLDWKGFDVYPDSRFCDTKCWCRSHVCRSLIPQSGCINTEALLRDCQPCTIVEDSICSGSEITERVDTGSMYVLYLPVIQADLCTRTTFRHMLYYSIVPASTLDWVYSSK